jgi:hypothetical protein
VQLHEDLALRQEMIQVVTLVFFLLTIREKHDEGLDAMSADRLVQACS